MQRLTQNSYVKGDMTIRSPANSYVDEDITNLRPAETSYVDEDMAIGGCWCRLQRSQSTGKGRPHKKRHLPPITQLSYIWW
jgi:hypothetical protein